MRKKPSGAVVSAESAALAARKAVFLAMLAEHGRISDACKRARVARASVYEWRESDQEFANAWDKAREIAGHAVEDSLMRRGRDGVLKNIYQGGKKVGTERVYDTTAAIFLLKGLFPQIYRERSTVDLNVIPNMPARLDAAEKRLKNLKEGE